MDMIPGEWRLLLVARLQVILVLAADLPLVVTLLGEQLPLLLSGQRHREAAGAAVVVVEAQLAARRVLRGRRGAAVPKARVLSLHRTEKQEGNGHIYTCLDKTVKYYSQSEL